MSNWKYSGDGINKKTEFDFEADYWGNCCNTLDEDMKQYCYAGAMGIERSEHVYSYKIHGKKILDIGGGPASILLKCYDHGKSKVVDPLEYPKWTVERYASNNIEYHQMNGEDITETDYDEVWIYNCLQHTIDPEKIIKAAKKAAPILRIFEWINIPAHDGHPQELKEDLLNKWIGSKGNVGNVVYDIHNNLINTNHPRLIPFDPNLRDQCYFGVFETGKK